MVLRHRTGKFSSGISKKLRPFFGIKQSSFRLKSGSKLNEIALLIQAVPDAGLDAIVANLAGADVDQAAVVFVAVAENDGAAGCCAGTASRA
jgi:hypothetical protein